MCRPRPPPAGILNVAAVDKGSGKTEKITITNDKGEQGCSRAIISQQSIHLAALLEKGVLMGAHAGTPLAAPLPDAGAPLNDATAAGCLSQEDGRMPLAVPPLDACLTPV